MKGLLTLPRKVLYAVAAIIGSLLLFAVLYPTLGSARDEAINRQARLNAGIGQVNTNIAQVAADSNYVTANKAEYEALVNSDRLIPHTRRTAVIALQEAARARGLTALNYSFTIAPATSLKSAEAQPTSGAYKLSVEDVALKVGAPIDGYIYGFMSDIGNSFPGGAVIEAVVVRRAPRLTDAILNTISRGQDARLVEGEIQLSWRTAQAQETE